jgi:hypothetical protein
VEGPSFFPVILPHHIHQSLQPLSEFSSSDKAHEEKPRLAKICRARLVILWILRRPTPLRQWESFLFACLTAFASVRKKLAFSGSLLIDSRVFCYRVRVELDLRPNHDVSAFTASINLAVAIGLFMRASILVEGNI